MDNKAKAALDKALDEIAEARFQACNAIHGICAAVEDAVCKALGASQDEASGAIMDRFSARWAENGRKFDALAAIEVAKSAALNNVAAKWADQVCGGSDKPI